jgi:uncharacterized RDD family membrane protein YckC
MSEAERKYQTFWPRFWAGVVDGIVFYPVRLLGLVVYAEGIPLWIRGCWYVMESFGFIAYVVLMHSEFGQTLGKMATGVKVLDLSESKLSGSQALRREIVPIGLTLIGLPFGLKLVLQGVNLHRPELAEVPGLIFWIPALAGVGWFAAELVTMLSNEKRRAVHDFIARSVVVRAKQSTIRQSRGAV